MGLFDLLRGFVPSAAQQLARNFSMASANPPPSWLSDRRVYGGPDVPDPRPLPDSPDGPDGLRLMPLPDFLDRRTRPRRCRCSIGRVPPSATSTRSSWPAPPRGSAQAIS